MDSVNNINKPSSRVCLLFGLFILFSLNSISQNLVPSYSFEDSVKGTLENTYGTLIDYTENWFTPRGGGGSSDWYFLSTYGSYYFSIPKNIYGYQYPNTGSHYAGIVIGDFDPIDIYPYREYIEVELTQSINPTRTYYLEFYVCLAERTTYAVSNFGVLFTKDTLRYNQIWTNYQPKIYKLHFEYNGQPITDTLNWTKISGYFKTNDEGYKFMTIGNFRANDSTNYQYVGYDPLCLSYYFIDDVLVMDSTQHAQGYGINELGISNQELIIYPNPANAQLNIEFQNFSSTEKLEILIFNSLGKLVKTEVIKASPKSLDVSDLSQGLYIVAIKSENEIIARDRFVISR